MRFSRLKVIWIIDNFRRLRRILQIALPTIRLHRSGKFDSNAYLRMHPDLPALPWYMPPVLHWVAFGQHTPGMRASPDLSSSMQIQRVLQGRASSVLTTSERQLLAALDQGNAEAASYKLAHSQDISADCQIIAAHQLASQHMRLEPAKEVILNPDVLLRISDSALLARQCLDLARATGQPTDAFAETMHQHSRKMRSYDKLLHLRICELEENCPVIEEFYTTWGDMTEMLLTLARVATQNERAISPTSIVMGFESRWKVIAAEDADLSQALEVRLPMPVYWLEPQVSHRVLGDVSRLFLNIFNRLLSEGRPILPVWSTPIYDISQDRRAGLPTLSYHTCRTENVAIQGDVHIKESYLPGYFTVDSLGYSGWSELATLSRIPSAQQTDSEYIAAIADRFLQGGRTKYRQSINAAPEPGFIFVALQLRNDTVAEHAYMDIKLWTEQVLRSAKDCRVVFKAHPLDHSNETRLMFELLSKHSNFVESDASIATLIEGAIAVVTVNSGVGFEALVGGCPVITCGLSDYAVATAECHTPTELDTAIHNVMLGQHEVKLNQSNAFVRFYLTEHCVQEGSLSPLWNALDLSPSI